jgi:hypothetical protein
VDVQPEAPVEEAKLAVLEQPADVQPESPVEANSDVQPVGAGANNENVLSQLIAQNNEAKGTGDGSPYHILQPGGFEFGHASQVTPIAAVVALLSLLILVCMYCRVRIRVSSDGDLHLYPSVNDKDSQGGMSDSSDGEDNDSEKMELGGMHEFKAIRRCHNVREDQDVSIV